MELRFDGTFHHCPQCGAFATKKENVHCDCLTGAGRVGGAPVLVLADTPESLAWDRIRDREALQRTHEARMRQGAEEDQRAVDRSAKARLAPVGYGCPVARYF